MDNKINELREELDAIDDKIAGLVEKRVRIARKIVGIKQRSGFLKDDFVRENAILERLSKLHPEISELLKNLYNRIFDWVKNQ